MQATLLRGRSFTEGDEDGKQPVAIIDESTSRKYWPTRDPLGRQVRFGKDPTKPWTTVVGVINDIKNDGLDVDGVPHIYVSVYQDPSKQVSVVLRTSLPAAVLEPQIRHEIQSIDPGLPVFNVSSMDDILDLFWLHAVFLPTWWAVLPDWRCFWPPSEFTAYWLIWSAKDRARSVFAWPWEPGEAAS